MRLGEFRWKRLLHTKIRVGMSSSAVTSGVSAHERDSFETEVYLVARILAACESVQDTCRFSKGRTRAWCVAEKSLSLADVCPMFCVIAILVIIGNQFREVD